jgi:hypothetical protein
MVLLGVRPICKGRHGDVPDSLFLVGHAVLSVPLDHDWPPYKNPNQLNRAADGIDALVKLCLSQQDARRFPSVRGTSRCLLAVKFAQRGFGILRGQATFPVVRIVRGYR